MKANRIIFDRIRKSPYKNKYLKHKEKVWLNKQIEKAINKLNHRSKFRLKANVI